MIQRLVGGGGRGRRRLTEWERDRKNTFMPTVHVQTDRRALSAERRRNENRSVSLRRARSAGPVVRFNLPPSIEQQDTDTSEASVTDASNQSSTDVLIDSMNSNLAEIQRDYEELQQNLQAPTDLMNSTSDETELQQELQQDPHAPIDLMNSNMDEIERGYVEIQEEQQALIDSVDLNELWGRFAELQQELQAVDLIGLQGLLTRTNDFYDQLSKIDDDVFSDNEELVDLLIRLQDFILLLEEAGVPQVESVARMPTRPQNSNTSSDDVSL